MELLFYNKSKEEVLSALNTNESSGLSSVEAASLLEKHGENKLKEKKKK